MSVLAIGVLGILSIEMGRYIKAKGLNARLALVLTIHAISFFFWREVLPFRSSLSLVVILYCQSMFLGFAYVLLVDGTRSQRVPPLLR